MSTAAAPGPPRYRWAVLGAGMTAQAGISAVQLGLPAVAPELRVALGLSLAGVGALLAAASLGIVATLLAWGALADRIGERAVIGIGLTGAAAFLALAGRAEGAWEMGACLAGAGAMGSAANAASGRAVVAWFPAHQRGLALGFRHMSTPAGGAIAAALLPVAAHAGGVGAVCAALAGACLLGAVVAVVVLREPPTTTPAAVAVSRVSATGPGASDPVPAGAPAVSPLRDGAIWRLSLGTGAVVLAQLSILSFLALYLHEGRGWSTAAAAAALAGVQVAGAVSRVVAGWWSDRVRSRMGPLRTLALASSVLLGAATLLLGLPLGVGVVLLIGAGVVAMAGNGVSFAAAAEMAGHARMGTALGLQNTVLFVAVVVAPPTFGALVGPLGWQGAFAVAAVCPLVGWWVLEPLRQRA